MHKFQVWDRYKNRMTGQQWMIPDFDRYEVLIMCGLQDKHGIDIVDQDIVMMENGVTECIVFHNYDLARWQFAVINRDEKDRITRGIPHDLTPEIARKMQIISNFVQEEEIDGAEEQEWDKDNG